MKVKLRDYVINPKEPGGIKLREEKTRPADMPSQKKFKHVSSTLAHIRKEASGYTPLRPDKGVKAVKPMGTLNAGNDEETKSERRP